MSTNRPILPQKQDDSKETQSPINYPPILIGYVEDNHIDNSTNNKINNDNITNQIEVNKDSKPDNNEVQARINQLESQIRNTSIQKAVNDKPYNPTFFKNEEPSVPNTKLSERLQKIKQRFKEKEIELNNKVKINKSDNAIFQKAKLLETVLNKNQANENISNLSVNSSNVDVEEEEQQSPIDIINNKPISKQKKKKPTKKNIFNNSSV